MTENRLADIVEEELKALGLFLQNSNWYGRENELVNLFAHSFLAKSIQVSQIGIEVAVKQIPTVTSKALVRKDLVIWESPNETVWIDGKPFNDPAVIVEFKTNQLRKCNQDIEWLASYTRLYPHVTGFSVCGYVKDARQVIFSRVEKGEVFSQQASGGVDRP